MQIEITLLIAILGGFVGLAGWLSGRDKKISRDSEWRGKVNAKLDAILGIKEDVKELGGKVDDHEHRLTEVDQRSKSNTHRLNRLDGTKDE